MKKNTELQNIAPLNLLFIVMVIFTLATGLFAAFVLTSSERLLELQKRNEKIAKLHGVVLQYDEILTMSARMAAATGDLKWERRYRDFEPGLDRALKELIALQPKDVTAAEATDVANAKLVEMENKSFQLLNNNKAEEASKVLFSQVYEWQKEIYSKGMSQLYSEVNEALTKEYIENHSHVFKLKVVLISLLLFSFCGWIYIYLTTRRLNKELWELNNTLDFRVKEQTVNLLSASKMASLGEMSGGIAHEINNPVGIIQGKANLLIKYIQSGTFTKEIGLEQLNKIVAMTDRIVKIVTGLKSFSRNAEKDSLSDSNINSLVNNVLSLCTERFRLNQINLILGEIPNLTFQCRGTQIEQVLLNLLSNAHDAVMPLKEKWIRLEAVGRENKIEFSVTDSGNGIPEPILEKLMQPFFTTKEVGKGTGLGLSISKGIVEDHHGKLWYDSSSKHTRFIVELPKIQPAHKAI